jgi:hypothetical protein
MNVIRENILVRIMWGIAPVVMWLGWLSLPSLPLLYVGAGAISDGHLIGVVFIVLGAVVCALVVLLTKPLWHKFFFQKAFLGIEAVTMVQWNDDYIHFSGAYFDLKISPKDIKSYNVPFGMVGVNTMYSIRIVVNIGTKVKWLWIGTTMPDKIKFLDFLDNLKLVNEKGKINTV